MKWWRFIFDAWAFWLWIIALGLLTLALSGCTQSRSDRQADTERRDTFTVSGSAVVPLPQGGTAVVPVELSVTRVGSERLVEHSESKTQIDGAAIAQQLGAVVSKGLDAVVAKMTGVQPSSGGDGGMASLLGLLGGTGGAGAIAYAVREAMSRRRLEVELRETKVDRDDGWVRAVDNAKMIRPQDLDARAVKPTK